MDKFSRRTLLHLHSQSFLSSYELSRVFNPFASEAVSARCSAISLEYFSPSDSVVHTFSNLGSVVVIFARRGGTLQRDGSRERERVHSLKTFHGIHSKCTPSKCDARGSNARTLAKRRRIFLSFLSLSFSGTSRRRARLLRAPSPRVVIILRVRAFPLDGNFSP